MEHPLNNPDRHLFHALTISTLWKIFIQRSQVSGQQHSTEYSPHQCQEQSQKAAANRRTQRVLRGPGWHPSSTHSARDRAQQLSSRADERRQFGLPARHRHRTQRQVQTRQLQWRGLFARAHAEPHGKREQLQQLSWQPVRFFEQSHEAAVALAQNQPRQVWLGRRRLIDTRHWQASREVDQLCQVASSNV